MINLVTNRRSIMASHMYVADRNLKRMLASDIFEFMNQAYKWIGGFKSFTGEDDFVDRSYLWYITYDGVLPYDEADIDINKVYTVSVYKQKYGLKLVGFGNNRFPGLPQSERRELKDKAKAALIEHVKFSVKRGWTEVSGNAEDMFQTYVSDKWIIDPYDLQTVKGFQDIEILSDGIHYQRRLGTGDLVTKVAYGTMRV